MIPILRRYNSCMPKAGSKVTSIASAISRIRPGSTIAVGGFGCCGVPNALLHEIVQQNISDLTVISNNAGLTNYGIGQLVEAKLIKRLIAAHIGSNKMVLRNITVF
jgi:acyl CoA:acetate/3-ketoacid CoA transferase alpha subunit